jgi:hypothetical protein
MRIDAGDGNARFRIADALEKSICNRDNGFDAGRIQGIEELRRAICVDTWITFSLSVNSTMA